MSEQETPAQKSYSIRYIFEDGKSIDGTAFVNDELTAEQAKFIELVFQTAKKYKGD